MAENLMHIPNDDAQNYPFCRSKKKSLKRLDTQLKEPT